MSTQFRNGVYYSRLNVPSDLKPFLNKREVVRSLNTSSYRDANLLAVRWEAHIADLFTHLRQNAHAMTKQQIHSLVNDYMYSTLEECEDERAAGEVSQQQHDGVTFAIIDALETNDIDLTYNRLGRISRTADELLEQRDIQLGPNRLDGTVWGVGASQIFPTASEDVLGQDKWQAGPAFLWAHLAPKPGGFNVGALAQHWWSYAGDDDRDNTSLTNIQYFINYRLSKTELVGMTPNITYNWKTDDSDDALTLPIGLGYSNVIKIGSLPVRIAAEIQYSVVSPDNIGADWNFRLMFIPVIANPFR